MLSRKYFVESTVQKRSKNKKSLHLECQCLGFVFSFDHKLQTRFVKPGHLIVLENNKIQGDLLIMISETIQCFKIHSSLNNYMI